MAGGPRWAKDEGDDERACAACLAASRNGLRSVMATSPPLVTRSRQTAMLAHASNTSAFAPYSVSRCMDFSSRSIQSYWRRRSLFTHLYALLFKLAVCSFCSRCALDLPTKGIEDLPLNPSRAVYHEEAHASSHFPPSTIPEKICFAAEMLLACALRRNRGGCPPLPCVEGIPKVPRKCTTATGSCSLPACCSLASEGTPASESRRVGFALAFN